MKNEVIKQRTVHVICSRFYDFLTGNIVIGGVETYITNLLPIFNEYGFVCRIYQFGKNDEDCNVAGFFVKSVGYSEIDGKRNVSALLKAVENQFDNERDVLLFADHWMTIKNSANKSLAIQHGIHWDIPMNFARNNIKATISHARFSYTEDKKLSYVNKVVCVDYNFPNWYRAQVDKPQTPMIVIPNFSYVKEKEFKKIKNIEQIKIIFARRLVEYRGTRIFANVAERLLDKYRSIHITIAGTGPDEEYLHNKLDKWGMRVSFIKYSADQSLDIHEDKNIAVIPTIGSEGTSLSLLEAMASQCAVVCTDVGGMTNIVIDDYNGLMVEAGNEDKLFEAIVSLIIDQNKRELLAQRGYDTVKNAFSFEKWKARWSKIIAEL